MHLSVVIQQLTGLFHGCFVFLFAFFYIHILYVCFYGQRSQIKDHICTNSNCTLHKCAITFMKNKRGKYLKLSKKKGLELIATNVQDGAITSNLEIWKWNNKIAFCFKYDAREIYAVTVHENKLDLRLLQQTTENAMKEALQTLNAWFQMDEVGTHTYCIRAANSAKYLTTDTKKRTSCVTLSDTQALDSTFTTSPCRCNEEGCPGV